jgi:hypothetical protein
MRWPEVIYPVVVMRWPEVIYQEVNKSRITNFNIIPGEREKEVV